MKIDEVPQDGVTYYAGARKALYALDASGHYDTVASSGWEAEAVVTTDAAAEYRRLAEEALQRVRAGLASPLEFHMHDRRMDLPTLAQSTGLWQWRVRRHLRPGVFTRLGDRLLARYADALGIPLEQLKVIP